MSANTLRISSRALLEHLAGIRDSKEFAALHHFDRENPFLSRYSQGQLLTGMRIQTSDNPDDDDEWIVFEFGAPDPAISPFVVPQIAKDTNVAERERR